MPAYHLIIKGKVQGVFFRATAKDEAEKLGLKGWVKNTDAGDVEAYVCGTEADLKTFINWCWQGPSRALVTNVIVAEKEEQELDDFKVLRN
jgi:acylphosphatase